MESKDLSDNVEITIMKPTWSQLNNKIQEKLWSVIHSQSLNVFWINSIKPFRQTIHRAVFIQLNYVGRPPFAPGRINLKF